MDENRHPQPIQKEYTNNLCVPFNDHFQYGWFVWQLAQFCYTVCLSASDFLSASPAQLRVSNAIYKFTTPTEFSIAYSETLMKSSNVSIALVDMRHLHVTVIYWLAPQIWTRHQQQQSRSHIINWSRPNCLFRSEHILIYAIRKCFFFPLVARLVMGI